MFKNVSEFNNMDLYAILQVPNDVNTVELRNKYHILAKKYHPDRNIDQNPEHCKTQFQNVQEAYSILSDPRKRYMYDLNPRQHDSNQHNSNQYNSNQHDSKKQMYIYDFVIDENKTVIQNVTRGTGFGLLNMSCGIVGIGLGCALGLSIASCGLLFVPLFQPIIGTVPALMLSCPAYSLCIYAGEKVAEHNIKNGYNRIKKGIVSLFRVTSYVLTSTYQYTLDTWSSRVVPYFIK